MSKKPKCPLCHAQLRYTQTEDGDWCLSCWECGFSGPTTVSKNDAKKALEPLLSKLELAERPELEVTGPYIVRNVGGWFVVKEEMYDEYDTQTEAIQVANQLNKEWVESLSF